MHLPLLDDSSTTAGLGAALYVILIVSLVLVVFAIVCYWRIFTKAGKPGWLAIIPIVREVYLLIIGGLSGWLILLGLVPVVNIILPIIIYWNLAKVFGKGAGFALGLIFLNLIFVAILAFDNSRYLGKPQTVYMAQPR
jgi:hypothetical protein